MFILVIHPFFFEDLVLELTLAARQNDAHFLGKLPFREGNSEDYSGHIRLKPCVQATSRACHSKEHIDLVQLLAGRHMVSDEAQCLLHEVSALG
jgi:hypothetical protein